MVEVVLTASMISIVMLLICEVVIGLKFVSLVDSINRLDDQLKDIFKKKTM